MYFKAEWMPRCRGLCFFPFIPPPSCNGVGSSRASVPAAIAYLWRLFLCRPLNHDRGVEVCTLRSAAFLFFSHLIFKGIFNLLFKATSVEKRYLNPFLFRGVHILTFGRGKKKNLSNLLIITHRKVLKCRILHTVYTGATY